MADKRISELTALAQAGVDVAQDQLAIADVSASETKKITPAELVSAGASGLAPGSIDGSAIADNSITDQQLAPDSVGSSELSDDAVDTAAIQDSAVTNDKLAGGITGDKLAVDSISGDQINSDSIDGSDHIKDRSIPAIKLVADTLTAAEISAGAIGTSELATGAVDQNAIGSNAVGTDELIDLAVTKDKLSANSIDGSKIESSSVDSRHIVNGAVDDVHLSSGIDGAKLVDGSVSNSKLATGIDGAKLSVGSVPNTAIQPNTLTADQIAPNAIGASELADGAVDTSAIKDDAISTPKYQNASVTNEKLASGIDGSKIIDGSINGGKLEPGTIDGNQIDSVPLDKLPNAPANNVLAGPTNGAAATPVYRSLIPQDLPTATTSTEGAVSVPTSGGLSLTAGAVGISNTVTPGGFPFVNYDNHGSITSGRALSGSDLPPPALGQLGAVKPGDGLSVSGDGTLNVIPATDSAIGGVIASDGITIAADGKISQAVTGVEADTYTKVTVDEMGNVTVGEQLLASDIPNLDWTQINNPIVDGNMLTDKSVQRRHMADYSTMYIQEVAPTVDTTVYVGTMWFRESTAGLSAWNGNSWMSIGQGRLSAENLRYAGIIDASTGNISGLTQFGVAEGLEIGNPVPAASDSLTGLYFVAQVAGDQVVVLPGVSFDPGDWCLCNGAAGGWVRIDTMVGGGGGGGGAANLNDLLDVSVGAATAGAFLQLQSSGQWADTYGIDGGEY